MGKNTRQIRTGSKATTYQPLVVVLVAVCVGMAADHGGGGSLGVWGVMAGTTWCLWLVSWRRGWNRTAGVLVLVATAGTGASWHHCRWYRFDRDDLSVCARAKARPVCLEATALGAPCRWPAPPPDPMQIIPRGERTYLEVEILALRDGLAWRGASGRAMLWVDGRLENFLEGDRLRIHAQLVLPRTTRNPGEFDSAAFARADRKLSVLRASFPQCVSRVGVDSKWSVFRGISRLRTWGSGLLEEHLDTRRAALAGAVLLGSREGLEPEWAETFQETGTIHLLAISGLHVGIVAMIPLGLARLLRLSHRQALLLVATVTVIYTLMTDARPPAIRATLLVLVTCAAHGAGSRRVAFNALAATGLVILILNPADLFRMGPQFSFLAVAGLMGFGPRWLKRDRNRDPLERLVLRSRGWVARTLWWCVDWLCNATMISAMIWLLAVPLVLARFHLLTPIAVVLNPLVLLPMTLAIWSGFALLLLGWTCPLLGGLAGKLCDANLAVVQWAVELGRALPGGHFWLPGPANWWLAGFYGALGMMGAFPRLRPPRRWTVALLAGWIVVGMAVAWWPERQRRLEVTFLSVGHGAGVVLELPSGQTMLYDAGSFASPRGGARTIAGYLWFRGKTHVDAVVLSHPDADHFNALGELLERFSIGVIYVSPVMFEVKTGAVAVLLERIEAAGVPIRTIRAGDRLRAGEHCRMEVLHPPRRGVLGGDNANSVVLGVEYRGRRILLTGDLESPGLEDVLAEEPWDCDVLMAPHHGSHRSNPPGLVSWCMPEYAIISSGLQGKSSQAEAIYRSAGVHVLHTGKEGAIRILAGGECCEVKGMYTPQ